MYRNLHEKIANNYAHFVNMSFKIVKYHMAFTFSKMSKRRLRYVPLIEHIELFNSTKKTEAPKIFLKNNHACIILSFFKINHKFEISSNFCKKSDSF